MLVVGLNGLARPGVLISPPRTGVSACSNHAVSTPSPSDGHPVHVCLVLVLMPSPDAGQTAGPSCVNIAQARRKAPTASQQTHLCSVGLIVCVALTIPLNALQDIDRRAGGFSHMLYWLQIQEMALQAAGGKPGPEAEAAAKKLIASLPHSAVLTRLAQGQASSRAAQHACGA